MNNADYLSGYFLIAMPSMVDSTFAKTVTLICEHNEKGAMGLILNRQLDMSVESLFNNLELPSSNPAFKDRQVLLGGPVQTERGFVLHSPAGDWQNTMHVFDNVGLTTSKDVLSSIATASGPSQWLITLGYAGWSAGQLESELVKNEWLTVRADPSIIFETPLEDRFDAAMALLGIDISKLSTIAGHA